MKDRWTLHVLGCRGSFPVCGDEYREFGGATSSYLLKKGDYAIVMDCGSGLYRAKELLKDCVKIDVLLTHVHYDHLIGMLNWGVFPPDSGKRFFGDFNKWFGRDTIRRFCSPPFWPAIPETEKVICVPSPGKAGLERGAVVTFAPSNHPNDASLLRVDVDEGSVCLASDYEHGKEFPAELIHNCGILLYDAMYTREEYAQHMGWGHSCWEEGCKLAHDHGVERLVITHHDPAKSDEELLKQERLAKAVMPSVHFARMGEVYNLSE